MSETESHIVVNFDASEVTQTKIKNSAASVEEECSRLSVSSSSCLPNSGLCQTDCSLEALLLRG